MTREIIKQLKKYCDGKSNTDKVEISAMQLNRIIKALEQQPTDAMDRVTIKEDLDSFGKDTNVATKENYNEQMEFPGTWEEFEVYYGFYDKEEVYTNNSRLIPSFRVKQWLEHQMTAESRMSLVQETVNTIMNTCDTDSIADKAMRNAARFVQNAIDGSYPDFEELPKWIPCSERLPKADEYVDDVAKYYLVQNEYGDMLVARYTHSGYWEYIYHYTPCDDEIVAWMPLPQPYKPEIPTRAEGSEE